MATNTEEHFLSFNISDKDTQKAVDNYKRQFELLATAIEKVRNEKLTGSDLYDLGKEFPELIDTTDDLDTALTKLVDETLAQVVQYLELTGASTGFINLFRQMADAAKTVETKADSVIELSQNIQTAYDLLEKVNEEADKSGELSLDTLSSIAKQFPELDEATAKYAQGLLSLTDILGLLNQAYDNNSKAYQAEMVQKLSNDEVFFAHVKNKNSDLFTELAEAYGIDVTNWKTMAQAKAEIDLALIQKLGQTWGNYFGVVIDQTTGLASLVNKTPTDNLTAEQSVNLIVARTNAEALINSFNHAKEAMDKAAQIEVDIPDFGNIGADKTSSGSDNSSQTQEFDWIKQKIDSITHARERLNKVITNERTPYLEQISTLNQIIAKDKELEEASKAAAEAYHKSWEDCAAKIAESDISKIMEGSLSIEEYTGPYAENLKTAQDAWSKYQDAVSQVDDYTNQTTEDIARQFEKTRNITNASIDRIKQHVSDVQNLMDEAEAMGLYTTEAQYRSLIQYADQEISKQKALRASYIQELASIKPGTEAYEKQRKAIQDCEDAISDCRQNQIKWNKSVLELPIQYINRELDGLNDDLNDLKKTQELLDNTISGVTAHLQEQVDAQQKLRDEAEKAAQEKIDAIQAEIDGLTKTNEKRKQQLELEQKQYDLNRARNQKTNRVFHEAEGEFVYEADQEAIRDAEQAYDETMFDRQIADLEDKITDIEESRETLLESYDQEIDRLQDIMDSWNDIAAAIERAKNIALAGTTLGAGWEDRVTGGDTSDFNHVTGEYGDNLRQQSWVEVQIEENERLIDQIEKYVEAWQLGELDIEEAYDRITDITTDIQPMIEANEERIADLAEFSGKWDETDANVNLSLGDINAANSEAALAEGVMLDQRISKLSSFTEQYELLSSRVSSACRRIIDSCREALNSMNDVGVEEGISSGASGAPSHDSDQDTSHGPGVYARGIENGLIHGAPSDKARENMLKYLSMVNLAKGEIPIIAHENEAVLNESQQVQLLKNFDTALSYGLYSAPQQLKALDQIYRHDISAGIVQSSKASTHSFVNKHPMENNVEVNFGDIHLPQVRNVDAFAKAVNNGFLSSMIQQQLYKRL